MTENVDKDLDISLEHQGYIIEKRADIMVCKIDKDIKLQGEEVKISMDMTNEWLEGFLNFNGTIKEVIKSTAKTMLSNIKNPIFIFNERGKDYEK